MVYFTTEQIRECMDHQDRIRNMSVIAHVDHGKSTLTDSLIAKAGIISVGAAGNTRFTDTRQDEKDRCITIKSTGVSLFYEYSAEEGKEKEGFLINLIDSPGHVDFSAEVTSALRVTDGALVVVDCCEGVCVQTETVLRQALAERVIPVLMLNKVDRVILELKLSAEDIYKTFRRTIGSVNALIATYQPEIPGIDDLQVDPLDGTVAFGAGLHGWGFTLGHFASMYASKYGSTRDKWVKNLWGNRFFNTKKGVWTNKEYSKDGGTHNVRGFCMYIMQPILDLFEAIQTEKRKTWKKMLKTLGVKLTAEEKEWQGKKLLKRIMQKFLPAADALLEMMILRLPSPTRAQGYRVDTLYTGPKDDEAYNAIKACDPAGPLMLYVSKMVPTTDRSRFFAFGRVFSGTVSTGQKVRILGPDFKQGKKTDLFIKSVQRTVLMMGNKVEQIDDCPAGNTVGLVGIDQFIIKSGTLTTIASAHTIKAMAFSVSPVVQVAVEAKNPRDLPKLMEGLKRLDKSDPCVLCFTTKGTNQHIVAGVGELHLEICLKDLRDDFCGGIEIITSPPIVNYQETITEPTPRTVMGKSANKHNRLTFEAEPMCEELVKAIETEEICKDQEAKARARVLADKFGWDVNEARKIWYWGPEGFKTGKNVLLEATRGVQYLNEIKDHINRGFQAICEAGPLAGEELVGAVFKLKDATLHSDAIHRGLGQIMPAARKAMIAACLLSKPMLLEPIYKVEIQTPQDAIGGIHGTLARRRGHVYSEESQEGNPLVQVGAYLPVAESFGFDSALRAATSGQAFPQCVFSHYQVVPSDPLAEGTQANEVMLSIRERKGMKLITPSASQFEDKL